MTDPSIPSSGTILRADNGDVIGYDATGLVLRLSDRVISDIAGRLDLQPTSTAAGVPLADLGPELPDTLDLWAVRSDGCWITFQANLPGAAGPRGYRRHVEGGAIIAEARGPLCGILGIGGARAALASPGPGSFAYHIFAPADDIGAVGMAGEGVAPLTALLQQLPELTHEALLAQGLLSRRALATQALPLFFVRAETDSAGAAGDLGRGAAITNFDRAVLNLVAAAGRLGTAAQVLAVTLDYVLEDVSGDPAAYRDGMIGLMERITRTLAAQGLARPVFLSGFDCGTQDITTGPALDGQWDLSWNHGDHQLVHTCPSYAFAIDDTGRLTDAGRSAKAAIAAEALLATQAGKRWLCPTIQLAERDGATIRLTCEAMDPLLIDPADPFGAGSAAGFALDGVTNDARIKTVTIDPADPKAVLLRCTKRPEGSDLHVSYAHGQPPAAGAYPANRGALRDTWGADGLHRWALPVRLRVTGGAS